MTRAMAIPDGFVDVPFTMADGLAAGLSSAAIRGRRFRRLFRGVYITSETPMTLSLWLEAGLLILPKDAVVSHLCALRLHGVEIGSMKTLEYSTNQLLTTDHAGITLHRRKSLLTPYDVGSLPVTGPERTIVDCATQLRTIELIQAADWLIHCGITTWDELNIFALTRHFSGVQRVRQAMQFVRSGVESPMETLVRLMLVFAGLPEPGCNLNILDENGSFLARGDMVYQRWKVLVEYDGWQHERDAKQRQRDRERREQLEAADWRIIVVTSQDLRRPERIPWRVFDALRARGFQGQAPHVNARWSKWFR